MNLFPGVVRLTCKAEVGGRWVEVSQVVAQGVYDDRTARPLVEKHLRRQLMDAILEEWSPVIHVER